MEQREGRQATGRVETARPGSSVATHRKGERMRTYVQHQRPEGRM